LCEGGFEGDGSMKCLSVGVDWSCELLLEETICLLLMLLLLLLLRLLLYMVMYMMLLMMLMLMFWDEESS
jgi:hypothetical protein